MHLSRVSYNPAKPCTTSLAILAIVLSVAVSPVLAAVSIPTVPDNLGTHDPSRVIEDDGAFYFYSTSDGVSGWYTEDGGDSWQQTPEIFPNGIPADVHAASPGNDGHSIWAPDVIYNPNTQLFNVYYAVADWYNGTYSAIGLVTSPTLNPSTAVWKSEGVVIARTPTDNTYSAIDPAPFFDPDGNMWMTLGSGYAETRSTALNLIALDKSTGLRQGSELVVVQACACEASYIQPYDGSYYLFWNTGGCCSGASSSYTIHVSKSDNLTGPYDNSQIFLASSNGVHGPGQIGFLTDDVFTYHYYPNSGGSVLGIGQVSWSGGLPTAEAIDYAAAEAESSSTTTAMAVASSMTSSNSSMTSSASSATLSAYSMIAAASVPTSSAFSMIAAAASVPTSSASSMIAAAASVPTSSASSMIAAAASGPTMTAHSHNHTLHGHNHTWHGHNHTWHGHNHTAPMNFTC